MPDPRDPRLRTRNRYYRRRNPSIGMPHAGPYRNSKPVDPMIRALDEAMERKEQDELSLQTKKAITFPGSGSVLRGAMPPPLVPEIREGDNYWPAPVRRMVQGVKEGIQDRNRTIKNAVDDFSSETAIGQALAKSGEFLEENVVPYDYGIGQVAPGLMPLLGLTGNLRKVLGNQQSTVLDDLLDRMRRIIQDEVSQFRQNLQRRRGLRGQMFIPEGATIPTDLPATRREALRRYRQYLTDDFQRGTGQFRDFRVAAPATAAVKDYEFAMSMGGRPVQRTGYPVGTLTNNSRAFVETGQSPPPGAAYKGADDLTMDQALNTRTLADTVFKFFGEPEAGFFIHPRIRSPRDNLVKPVMGGDAEIAARHVNSTTGYPTEIQFTRGQYTHEDIPSMVTHELVHGVQDLGRMSHPEHRAAVAELQDLLFTGTPFSRERADELHRIMKDPKRTTLNNVVQKMTEKHGKEPTANAIGEALRVIRAAPKASLAEHIPELNIRNAAWPKGYQWTDEASEEAMSLWYYLLDRGNLQSPPPVILGELELPFISFDKIKPPKLK